MKKASYVNLSRQESGALLVPAVGTAVEILRFAQDDTKKECAEFRTSLSDKERGFGGTPID